MKTTKHKKQLYIIAIAIVGFGLVFVWGVFRPSFTSNTCSSTTSVTTQSIDAAIPPQSASELADESDVVVEGEVCQIVRTYTDGDERDKKCPRSLGCVGGGTDNSQDVVIAVNRVNKGKVQSTRLELRKPISAYSLSVGDKGTFYINGSELVGEYWPVE